MGGAKSTNIESLQLDFLMTVYEINFKFSKYPSPNLKFAAWHCLPIPEGCDQQQNYVPCS
jgi:hypothetical protein